MILEYTRGLRESRSVEEAEVMFVGFLMRNAFRQRLVTGLMERGYHEGKLEGGGIGGAGREVRCHSGKMSAKGLHGSGWIRSDWIKRLGAGGRVSGGWLPQEGSNASGWKRAGSNATGC